MITPVLLCGGSGTRLWPLSRKSYPKQFASLVGDKSLFQSSALRVDWSDYNKPLVLTNSDFRFIVTQQMSEVGVDPDAVLIEPDGRNTAPAILAAALWLEKTQPDTLMLITPSDHIIPDQHVFDAAINAGVDAARDGQLVTFGIKPTYPETGYGYLELSEDKVKCAPSATRLKRFVEKPDQQMAEEMIASGRFLWNAGIFLFSVQTILKAFRTYAPDLLQTVQAAIKAGKTDLGFFRIDPENWKQVQDISIDYAVMEHADNLAVVPFDGGWSDLGGWDAVWRETTQDRDGVATSDNATAIDCANSLLRSEDDSIEMVGIGLSNIIAVAMQDAVLVADTSRAQDVKKAVSVLKEKQIKQAECFPKEYRPWGWFESLVTGNRFQVKRIMVNPGAALSLQSHHHRSEHWIVVQGTAKVTIDDDVRLVTENESIYVPVGAVHRMENPGKMPMILIEVQTGAYLEEDDITRYKDDYSRK